MEIASVAGKSWQPSHVLPPRIDRLPHQAEKTVEKVRDQEGGTASEEVSRKH